MLDYNKPRAASSLPRRRSSWSTWIIISSTGIIMTADKWSSWHWSSAVEGHFLSRPINPFARSRFLVRFLKIFEQWCRSWIEGHRGAVMKRAVFLPVRCHANAFWRWHFCGNQLFVPVLFDIFVHFSCWLFLRFFSQQVFVVALFPDWFLLFLFRPSSLVAFRDRNFSGWCFWCVAFFRVRTRFLTNF